MVTYLNGLKQEESIGLIIDDCTFESRQTDIIDYAFATQCAFINLKGIGRGERVCKVERF